MSAAIHAATGHRPDKLGGYGTDTEARLITLATAQLTTDRPEEAISGMALGWDMAWAFAALELGIAVHAAIPFEGQETRWPSSSQQKWAHILKRCAKVTYVCDPGYAAWKMQVRNAWMVDNSTKVIALWDGSSGGTGNCIRYATKAKKPIVNLWSKY